MPERKALLEHVGFLRALALSLLQNEADADDVVQQTLATAMERPPAAHGNLRAWLATVTRNFALLTHRRRKRARERELKAARPESTPSPAEIAARLELERKVVDAVAELEEPYRTTVILRFYDGLQPTAIARHLGVPASTVRVRLKRGLDRLRVRLEEKTDRKELAVGLLLLAQLPEPDVRRTPVRLATAAAVLVAVGGLAWLVAQPWLGSDPGRPAAPASEVASTGPRRTPSERDAERRTVTLRGRIVDSLDRPRAGIEVELYEAAARGRFTTLAHHAARLLQPPEPLARAVSDREGRYAIEAPATHAVVVQVREEEVVVEAEADLDGLDFRLVGAPVTRGRLVDGEGLPLAGSRVSGTPVDEDGWFELPGEHPVLVVRAPGLALRLLRGPPPYVVRRGPALAPDAPEGASVILLSRSAVVAGASAPEFPDEEPRVVATAPGFGPHVGPPPVRLRPGRTIEGVVRCEGEPVAGADVTWFGTYDAATLAFTQLEVARTDEDGRYRLTQAPPDAVGITATHSEYLPRGGGLADYLGGFVEPHPEPHVEMVRALVKKGRVVGADGLPVAGARVRAWPRRMRAPHSGAVRRALARAGLRWSAVSGRDGTFSLRQLPPGVPLQVVAEHPVHGRATAVDAWDLRLSPWEIVEGDVVDEHGAPVAGALITGDGVRGWSGPAGRYRLRGRPDGELRVSHPALVTRIARFQPRITLLRGEAIRGRVDAPGALVLAGSRSARADAEGRFEVTGLEPGHYRVEFQAAGRVSRVVEADAGGASVDVSMEPAGHVEGLVLRPGSVRVAGARVHVFVGARAADHALTDSAGHFRLDGVPERAPFQLVIRHPECEELRVENVTAGGGRRTYQMREAAK
ncbi:MAG: sigma-70 family RNA polymerase sigma factor [Planctomycetota bacterium]